MQQKKFYQVNSCVILFPVLEIFLLYTDEMNVTAFSLCPHCAASASLAPQSRTLLPQAVLIPPHTHLSSVEKTKQQPHSKPFSVCDKKGTYKRNSSSPSTHRHTKQVTPIPNSQASPTKQQKYFTAYFK